METARLAGSLAEAKGTQAREIGSLPSLQESFERQRQVPHSNLSDWLVAVVSRTRVTPRGANAW